MQSYTELTPPTAVTHSLSLPFLSSTANNLVLVKTSLLQIFSLKSVIATADERSSKLGALTSDGTAIVNGSGPVTTRSERVQTTKLVLLAQYELSGTVTSIARVKILKSKSGGEAILVALHDAKLSLVEWDPERYGISTISIHYYGREDILFRPWEPDLAQCSNILSVDPSSRCAVYKFGSRHLAILPFHQPGDDIAMDDYDPGLDGEGAERKESVSDIGNGPGAKDSTPYAPSFVLSLLALDPALTHPIHLSFLYEYREPTFGILSSQNATSTTLLNERRDNVSYAVYNLDLEQRASTTLLSVNNLPYDLFEIIPLSRTVGGVLLVGGNELVHVDQSGKTNGVAVNEMARQCTSFALADQSELKIRLEGAVIKQLGIDSPDLLIIQRNGDLLMLSFKIDGRSVSGLHVRHVDTDNSPLLAGASCASSVGRGRMFVGSQDADSVILGWSRASDRLKRQRSRTDFTGDNDELADLDDMDFEDEDDLYADDKHDEKVKSAAAAIPAHRPEDDYKFRVHDTLLNFGPMSDVAFGILPLDGAKPTQPPQPKHEFMTTSGRGRAGALMSLRSDIVPQVIQQYNGPPFQAAWTVCAKKSAGASNGDDFDNYLITTSQQHSQEQRKSNAFALGADVLVEVQNTDFDPDAGATVDVGTLNGGTRIVQVLANEVRTFDADFGLAQIYPLSDDDSGAESKVVGVSFTDPYILLIKDDQSLSILTVDEDGDLDEVEQGENFKGSGWLSGSLYEDANDVLQLSYGSDDEEDSSNVLMFLLSAAGGLQIYRLPSLRKPVYVAEGLSFLPPFLSTDFYVRRSSCHGAVIEILIAELGDSVQKAPYMILRTVEDDLVIYQPYQSPIQGSKDTSLRFLKLPSNHASSTPTENGVMEEDEIKIGPRLRAIHALSGYSTVWVPGSPSSLILKSASSPPQNISLSGASITNLHGLHTSKCSRGFLYVDGSGILHGAMLPLHSSYATGWVSQKISLDSEVNALSYHSPSQTYILSTIAKSPFKLPEDESHRTSTSDDESFLPEIDHSTLQLFDRKTCRAIDRHNLDRIEVATCIETVSLETSEHTHERQDLVCVGTAIIRGEDLPSLGRVYVFAIIDVVPEPDHPETGRAFKLICKEEVKGAVTALSGVGTQGFLLVAHGQKCMVRGLKEDGSLLPVAFMDMQCYVSVAKELPATGFCLMGDAIKGVWFTGYTEDPYQLRLFSKSPYHIETITASFLPDGRNLYIVVADAGGNLHVLQYDPEHPKSLSGHHLLPSPPFHTPNYPSTLTLIPPSHPNAGSLLLTSPTGSLSLITPLPASTHRTLSSLQSHLLNTLPHPLGLNPRAFRTPSGKVGSVAEGAGAGRVGIIDGNIIRRWNEPGNWRRWGGEDAREVRRAVYLATGGGK
ncbi:MAG: hypothetical protein Q9163_003249 [Psora crenata]